MPNLDDWPKSLNRLHVPEPSRDLTQRILNRAAQKAPHSVFLLSFTRFRSGFLALLLGGLIGWEIAVLDLPFEAISPEIFTSSNLNPGDIL